MPDSPQLPTTPLPLSVAQDLDAALEEGFLRSPAAATGFDEEAADGDAFQLSSNIGKTKKRPYIRTKRPQNYCDKSTISTTTDAVASVHVYDTVLAEASDLMLAASEAQRLGRLKLASGYLLLLHARLVGLGKRFDKQGPLPPESPTDATPKTAGARRLAKLLPQDIEMDQAMIEHLAKAAAELHASRSRKRGAAALSSPVLDAKTFLSQTANQQGGTNAVTKHSFVWTDDQVAQLKEAMEQGLEDPVALANACGRTPAQVKAYLRSKDAHETVGWELGRKPVTTAMNTDPNATCSVRELLQKPTTGS